MRLARDNASVQSENKNLATRVLESGTRINISIGGKVIFGTLNDSETAKAFLRMLPLKIQMSNSGIDLCGVLPEALPYNNDQVHNGWLNGDIDFATDGNWLAILYTGEEQSDAYGYQVNIGKIDGELSMLANLAGSYAVLVELAR